MSLLYSKSHEILFYFDYFQKIKKKFKKGIEYRCLILPTKIDMTWESYYWGHRNNIILCTMAIVYSADMPREIKRRHGKRENADGAVDKMKCNGSHSTATDRSFFQRISRVARNFGLWWSKVRESFCKRRDTRLKKNVSAKNERSFNILRNVIAKKKSIIYNVYIIREEICLQCCVITVSNSIQEH